MRVDGIGSISCRSLIGAGPEPIVDQLCASVNLGHQLATLLLTATDDRRQRDGSVRCRLVAVERMLQIADHGHVYAFCMNMHLGLDIGAAILCRIPIICF